MRKTLLILPIAAALLGIGGPAQSAVPMLQKPTIAALAETVICRGNRRSYRNFNHCVRVNRAPKYCSRICHE